MKVIVSQQFQTLSQWAFICKTNPLLSKSNFLQNVLTVLPVSRTRTISCLSCPCTLSYSTNHKTRQKSLNTFKGQNRFYSQEEKTLRLDSKPPKDEGVDFVGPPDPDSNLRPHKKHIPTNETPTEKAYREQLEETYRWNHNFWASHNKKFSQSKERYIQNELAKLNQNLKEEKVQHLSAEHLSLFYRQFLAENYAKHRAYNKEWYKRNIRLLWPALKVAVIRLQRMLSKS